MVDGPDPLERFRNLLDRLVLVVADPTALEPLADPDDARRRLAESLDVGMVRHHRGDAPWTTFVVKATFTYAGMEGPGPIRVALAPERIDLSPAEPSWLPGAGPRELYTPDDMVPGKAGVDVLLVGHAYAERPAESIACRLVVGACTRVFHVEGEAPERAQGLVASQIRTAEALEAPPVGPLAVVGADALRRGAAVDAFDEDEGFERFHFATPLQRLPGLASDAVIELTGLRRGHGTTELQLPGVTPAVEVEMGGDVLGDGRRPVEMRLDTVWIDTDNEDLTLVWRGAVSLPDEGRTVLRVVVGLTEEGEETPWRRGLIRGRVGYLRTPEDVREERFPEPGDDDPRAMAARYFSFLESSPEPRIDLQTYVEIASEVAETITPQGRASVLEEHGYTEHDWLVEERAWLEKIARAARDGDATLAHAHAIASERAQARLGERDEELTLDRYAELRAWMERSHQPAEVLQRFELSIPAYARHDRRWRARAEEEPGMADALAGALRRHGLVVDDELERRRVAQEEADAEREARWREEDEALREASEEAGLEDEGADDEGEAS